MNDDQVCKLEEYTKAITDNVGNVLTLIQELTLDKTEIIVKDKDSCLDCVEWVNNDEVCFKFKVRPPATVIVNACPNFSRFPF